MENSHIIGSLEAFRIECRSIEVRARMLHRSFSVEGPDPDKAGEVKANFMLAVRHLEDARMRFGKAIQYLGDGVSCYDKNPPPEGGAEALNVGTASPV